ncbi:MAG TPA: LpqB family beta-propeller domain-containing protein [Blastocatellia bacterium]|nr:LpqB family beta-propeller domain-containing protein [Blastocatellia bacterium]
MNNAPLVIENTRPVRSSDRLLRAAQWLLLAIILLIYASTAHAQNLVPDVDYAIFVSQREGATELYLLDLNTRQVSQLTQTGRAHITPYIASGARILTFASREGSSYELFTAQISSAWRTRRPELAAINRLTFDSIDEISPSLSNDATKMAFASSNGIEVMGSTGEGRRVLVPSSESYFIFAPAISPDGRQVAFISNRSGANEIWMASATTGETRQLTSGGAVLGGLSWSADGQQIVFTTAATASKLSGIAIASAVDGSFRLVTRGDNDGEASISSSGTFIIFTSLRDGNPELYLLNLRDNSVERLTNNPGVDGGAVFVQMPTSSIRRTPTPGRTVR